MTPAEEQWMRAQVMRATSQPIPQGMINQSVNAGAQGKIDAMSQDISGAERGADAQRAFAQQLRGRAAPKGKTVGPSGLYVGPNWGESLEYAVNQGLGGYMAGQANKKDTALDEQRTAKLRAEVAQEQANKDRTFGQGDRRLDLTLQGLDQDQSQFDTSMETDVSQFGQTLALEQAGLDEEIRATGVEEDQGQQGLDLDERGLMAEEAELATMPMVDTEGVDRSVRTVADPDKPGQFVTLDEKNQPVDITGWKNSDDVYGASGTSGTSPHGRIYSPKRHVDAEGNAFTIGTTADGRYWDVDNQVLIPAGDFTKQGMRAEAPVSEFQLNKAVNTYIESDTDQRRLMHDIEAAEETWEGNGWNPNDPDDVPLGFWTKQDNLIGGAARLGSDILSEGSPTGDNYAATKTVMNNITRLRAGLSQTLTEVANIKAETGLDVMSDPEVFMQYWGRLKKFVEADRRALEEGLSPTVRKEIKRRKKLASEDGPEIDGSAVVKSGKKDGKNVFQLKDGRTVYEDGTEVK